MKFDQKVLDWLLEPDQPVVRYYALVDLLDHKKSESQIREVHSKILKRGWAKEILAKQKPGGYWEKKSDLYKPKYLASNWKMIVLSDMVLKAEDDNRILRGCQLFFEDWLGDEDKFEIEGEVCISGNLARFLTRFGYSDDRRVKRIFDWLVNDQKDDGGWHCFKSSTGTLDGWEALAAFAALPRQKRTKRINRSIERGAEFYLERGLHREGRRYEPWFRFHYPNHYYYDLLVGLDVISSLGFGYDKRLSFALRVLNKKRKSDGRWELDAVHPDLATGANYTLRNPNVTRFALEKQGDPSKWITLKALQVLKRVEESS
ncbi:MAG: hypothetical protein OK439_04910 [Thaumarchaeota archaeon]|nr:hypothetical protein [Nitrososphaerota archaeon]